jgi:uncharacterized caspase-like protein
MQSRHACSAAAVFVDVVMPGSKARVEVNVMFTDACHSWGNSAASLILLSQGVPHNIHNAPRARLHS